LRPAGDGARRGELPRAADVRRGELLRERAARRRPRPLDDPPRLARRGRAPDPPDDPRLRRRPARPRRGGRRARQRAVGDEVARPPDARRLGRPRADGRAVAGAARKRGLGAGQLPGERRHRGAAVPLTVGAAGHIDHGKTARVEALAGKNTDRLPEEHERGISIDLGYAPLELLDGTQLSVVDVPGHERFVRTMVAGASGIDLFLLVIDAGEGARPQTREHLAILRLLGIELGVVALTKADLVDEETLGLARLEAEELVPGAPVVATSARTGAGLDVLRAALAEVASRVERHTAEGPARLHVDRSFTL